MKLTLPEYISRCNTRPSDNIKHIILTNGDTGQAINNNGITSGIADGNPLGPTVHTVTGNNLSGVTGIYMFPEFSGFDSRRELLTS